MTTSKKADLRGAAAQGARASAGAVAAVTAIAFLQTAILARLLGPEAFGLMALVDVALSFLGIIGQFGLSPSVVRSRDFDRGELSAVFWFQFIMALGLMGGVVASSDWLHTLQHDSELPLLLAVSAIVLPITVAGSVHRALSQRDLNFRLIALVNVSQAATTAVIAVFCAALLSQGVWSFVWGSIAGNLVATSLFLSRGGYRRTVLGEWPAFRKLKGHLVFGVNVTGSQLIGNGTRKLDRVLIGALLGQAALGYYAIAMNLVGLPAQKLNPIVTTVALPLLARLAGERELMRDAYLRILRLLVQAAAPVLLGLAAVAPDLVPIYLGSGWEDIVPLIQVLCLYGLSRVIANTSGPVIMASGRTFALVVFQAVGSVAQLAAVAIGCLSGSLTMVAVLLVLTHFALTDAQRRFILAPRLGALSLDYWGAIFSGLAAAGIMYFGVAELRDSLLVDMPGSVRLVVSVLVGAILYSLGLLAIERNRMGETIKLVLGRSG